MKKYDIAFKLKVIHHYLNTNDSYVDTAKLFGIGESTFEKWLKQFKLHGKKGLQPSKKTYSIAFKYQVVQELLSGKSARQIALFHNISSSSLVSDWLRCYEQHGLLGLGAKIECMNTEQLTTKKDEDKTKAELLEEIAYLRAECAYVKKSIALTQQKEQTKKKP